MLKGVLRKTIMLADVDIAAILQQKTFPGHDIPFTSLIQENQDKLPQIINCT